MKVILLLLSLVPGAGAQGFGQNQVILDGFEWKVRSTEHFDIHYYEGSAGLVPEAARDLEDAFASAAKALDVQITTVVPAGSPVSSRGVWARRPFFLYASPNDFQQSTIVSVGEGTGGVTEPFKDRFMVYNDGSETWLREVIAHEFVHVMQFHVLLSGFWRSIRVLRSIVYPLWMMEGMPGYLTHHIESTLEETTIRDAATSGGLLPLTRLEHFGHLKPHQVTLAYKQGAAAMEFLASQFGRRKVAEILHAFNWRGETNAALMELTGMGAGDFDRKFREHTEEKYLRLSRRAGLREPGSFGQALTRSRDDLPQVNTSPVVSPDGGRMYFLSTGRGHPPEIREMDLRSGRERKIPGAGPTRIDYVPMGNFANLSRVLSLSSDGGRLAFAGTRNHRDSLYVYDTVRRSLKAYPLKEGNFQAAAQPSLSPDGRRLVFSGMREGRTDLYILELASGSLERLTADARDDQTPAFTPDGNSVVWSAETPDPGDPDHSGRRLMRMNLADRSVSSLESLGGSARDPMVSPDGRRVLFVLDRETFSEICELELETGKARRLTRSFGGSFTPAYAPGGQVVFAALRRGSVHVHMGPRSEFLSEDAAAPLAAPEAMGHTTETSGGMPALSAERPYRFTAGTDLFLPAVFYSSDGGLFLTEYWQGSDLLGRHQAAAAATFSSGNGLFDYSAQYAYSRLRPQFFAGVGGRGQREAFDPRTGHFFNEALHGQTVGVSFPFDRYHRADLAVASVSERLRWGGSRPDEFRETRAASYSLTRDTVRGRYLVATRGNRLSAFLTHAEDAFGGNQKHATAGAEAQQFIPTGGQSALAARILGIQSVGRDSSAFLLGGVGGVRGYGRSTTRDFGSRLAVGNLEWRFPVIPDLNVYWWWMVPDFYFKAVYGAVFTDAGYAWNSRSEGGGPSLRRVRNSVGLGLRIHTFILQEFPLLVSMDYAHRTTQDGGIFYVYLGQVF